MLSRMAKIIEKYHSTSEETVPTLRFLREFSYLGQIRTLNLREVQTMWSNDTMVCNLVIEFGPINLQLNHRRIPQMALQQQNLPFRSSNSIISKCSFSPWFLLPCI